MLEWIRGCLYVMTNALFLHPTPIAWLVYVGLPALSLVLVLLFFRKKLWTVPLLAAGFGLVYGVIYLGKHAFSLNEYSGQFFGIVFPMQIMVGLVMTGLVYAVRSLKTNS